MSGAKRKGKSNGNASNTNTNDKNKKTQPNSSTVDDVSNDADDEPKDEDQDSVTEMNGAASMSEEEKDAEALCQNLQSVNLEDEGNYYRLKDDCFPLLRDRDAVYFEGTKQHSKSKDRRPKDRQQKSYVQVEASDLGFLDIRKLGGSPPSKWHSMGGAELFNKAPRHIRQEQLQREQAQAAAGRSRSAGASRGAAKAAAVKGNANDFKFKETVTSVRRCEHQNSTTQNTTQDRDIQNNAAPSSSFPSSSTSNTTLSKKVCKRELLGADSNSYWTAPHLSGWIQNEFKKKEASKNENQQNSDSYFSDNPQQSYWDSPAETIVSPKGPFFPSLYPSENRREQQERSARNGNDEPSNTAFTNPQSTSAHTNSFTEAHSSVFTAAHTGTYSNSFGTVHNNGYISSNNDTCNGALNETYTAVQMNACTPTETDDDHFTFANEYSPENTLAPAYNDVRSVGYSDSQDYVYTDTHAERYDHALPNGYANAITNEYRDPVSSSYENMLPNGYEGSLFNGYQHEQDEYDTVPAGYRNTHSNEFENLLPNGYGSTSNLVGNMPSIRYSEMLPDEYANSHSNNYVDSRSTGYADSFSNGYEDRHIGGYTGGHVGRNGIHGPADTGTPTNVAAETLTVNTNNLISSQPNLFLPSQANAFIAAHSSTLVTSQTDPMLPTQTNSLATSQRATLIPSHPNLPISGHNTFLPGHTRTLLPELANGLLPVHTNGLHPGHADAVGRELISENAALSASHNTAITPPDSVYNPQTHVVSAAAADADQYFAAYSGMPAESIYSSPNSKANSLNNFPHNNYYIDGRSGPLHVDNNTRDLYSELATNMNTERYADYRTSQGSHHESLNYHQNGIFSRHDDGNYPLGCNVPYAYDNGQVWSTDTENSNVFTLINQPHVEDGFVHSQSGLDLTANDRVHIRQPSNIPSSNPRNYFAADYPVSGNVLPPTGNSGLPQGATNNFRLRESTTTSSGPNQMHLSFMINDMRMPNGNDNDSNSAYSRYSHSSRYNHT